MARTSWRGVLALSDKGYFRFEREREGEYSRISVLDLINATLEVTNKNNFAFVWITHRRRKRQKKKRRKKGTLMQKGVGHTADPFLHTSRTSSKNGIGNQQNTQRATRPTPTNNTKSQRTQATPTTHAKTCFQQRRGRCCVSWRTQEPHTKENGVPTNHERGSPAQCRADPCCASKRPNIRTQ